MKILWNYQTTPGVQQKKTTRILNTSLIQLTSQQPTLIMFAHPQCPCTKASITELQGIAQKLRGHVNIKIFFIHPASKDRGWVESSSWALAKKIPDAQVLADPRGMMAKMFSARVSGETLLYSKEGELLFEGGITPSRGHIGENHGTQSIVEAVQTGASSIKKTQIYGCSLFTHEEEEKLAWK
ncbi:MAG: hypothetical protein JSU04_02570 [Bdellovibrionales bacterium]|nr:hypothetical protein [Bdellovibrionales bacterium]